MSALSPGYFSHAQSVREACAGTYKTEYALNAAIIAAIAVAVAAAETFSATVSVSGYSAQDIQNNIQFLRAQNFIVTQAGTTLTITW